ncbi:MAG: ABC transporter ATP-binding protein [Planctomycetes bacterium]|nr:ABC transporter ATP-binding protein [Planctomycetota bacterium]
MANDPSVEIQSVSKHFGGLAAVDRVSLDIRRGEFFSLLGPSGCGKTTLLRIIAGLETSSAGAVRIHGRDMTAVPAHHRPVHMVFQHYALFPHLSVGDNIAFGLRYKGVPRGRFPAMVADALALVRLGGLESRRPDQLSGGQRQRVALARALVLQPEVLLLDEPLGALDQKLRKEMQVELKNLQRKLGITFVLVTHDQEEALTMSDRLAVMNAGRVEQVDAAREVFESPRTEFVAEFMGAANFFTGTVRRIDGSAILVACQGLDLPLRAPGRTFVPGQSVRFIVRPEKMRLHPTPPARAAGACMEVAVEQRVYQGVSTTWIVRSAAGERFTVYEQNDSSPAGDAGIVAGGRAYLCWDLAHAVIVEPSAPAPLPAPPPQEASHV